MEIAGRQVGAVGGVMENFPLEVLQQIFADFCHMRMGIVLQQKNPFWQHATSAILDGCFQFAKVLQNLFALTVPPISNHSNRKGLFSSKKHVSITFPAQIEERAFFGRGEPECRRSILICFVAGLKKWHQVSSQATIRDRKLFPSVR